MDASPKLITDDIQNLFNISTKELFLICNSNAVLQIKGSNIGLVLKPSTHLALKWQYIHHKFVIT